MENVFFNFDKYFVVSLSFPFFFISKVGDDSVKELNVLTNLKNLDISHCASVTDEGINHIMLMPARLNQFFCDGVLHITDL